MTVFLLSFSILCLHDQCNFVFSGLTKFLPRPLFSRQLFAVGMWLINIRGMNKHLFDDTKSCDVFVLPLMHIASYRHHPLPLNLLWPENIFFLCFLVQNFLPIFSPVHLTPLQFYSHLLLWSDRFFVEMFSGLINGKMKQTDRVLSSVSLPVAFIFTVKCSQNALKQKTVGVHHNTKCPYINDLPCVLQHHLPRNDVSCCLQVDLEKHQTFFVSDVVRWGNCRDLRGVQMFPQFSPLFAEIKFQMEFIWMWRISWYHFIQNYIYIIFFKFNSWDWITRYSKFKAFTLKFQGLVKPNMSVHVSSSKNDIFLFYKFIGMVFQYSRK